MADSSSESCCRSDVKRLAYQLNPDAWVSYSGKTPKEKRWIDHLRTEALDNAARELGFANYLAVPAYDTEAFVEPGGVSPDATHTVQYPDDEFVMKPPVF